MRHFLISLGISAVLPLIFAEIDKFNPGMPCEELRERLGSNQPPSGPRPRVGAFHPDCDGQKYKPLQRWASIG